jgi:hypothetical protein
LRTHWQRSASPHRHHHHGPLSHGGDKPYPRLLGKLGERPEVSALCLFLDPITDIAVLSSPGDYDREDAYQALTTSVSPCGSLTLNGQGYSMRVGQMLRRQYGCSRSPANWSPAQRNTALTSLAPAPFRIHYISTEAKFPGVLAFLPATQFPLISVTTSQECSVRPSSRRTAHHRSDDWTSPGAAPDASLAGLAPA